MRDKVMSRRVLMAVIIVSCFFFCSLALAGGYFHIVQKGDTLWDICEKYYGNPWLWPKLWEMNPFVTNPNLLKPGDKINLLEDVPLVRPAAREREKRQQVASVSKSTETSRWWEKGLDVSGLANVKSIGYFSRDSIDPVGSIISSDTERLILAERDKIIIRIEEGQVRPGDILWVFRMSKQLRHPRDNSLTGYVISILGNVRIEKAVKNELYQAEVNETFRDIRVGDMLTTYNPVSSCVVPSAAPNGFETEIIATKDLLQIIGQFGVVYLDAGHDSGLNRGNLFEVLKERQGLPDLVIAYVLVLDARPQSATGVVVEAKEHFFSGAKLRAIEWEKAPHYLSTIPRCQ